MTRLPNILKKDPRNNVAYGMSKLPKNEPEYRVQTTKFGGMNVREKGADGELVSCKNLSTRNYPALSPRLGRTAVGSYGNPTGLFAWDKLVVCDGEKLLYDGNQVGTVAAGEKQFAVVNTKLCIFPDKKYIDITTGKCKSLEAEAVLEDGVFSGNSISGTVTGLQTIQQQVTVPHRINIGTGVWEFFIYDTIDTSTTPPTLSGGNWVQANYISASKGKYIIPAGSSDSGYSVYNRMNFAGTHAYDYYGTPNTDGVYGVISSGFVKDDGDSDICTLRAVLYKSVPDDLTKLFSVGDVVELSGSVIPGNNKHLKVLSVSANGLTFSGNAFFTAVLYDKPTRDLPSGTYDYRNSGYSSSYFRVVLGNGHKAGDVVLINSSAFQVQDEKGTVLETGTVTQVSDYGNRRSASICEKETITVKRSIPDMDYICQNGNRLWGVSNRAENTLFDENGKAYTYEGRCIYASALGNPRNFFDYSGLSTDSYAVGVASKGDFTGICAYSDDVLCWKEAEMLRITGSYPAAYYMYSYTIPGVKPGGHKSLQVIREVLYYLSNAGVFAYSGSAPTLLSYKLGDGPFSGGVAGTDGRRYYLSFSDAAGVWHLVTYDTETGLWMEEDDTHALDFCILGGVLYLLAGATVYTIGMGSASGIAWEAVLQPFYEDSFLKKYYRALLLRGELSKGAQVQVYATIGNEEESLVGECSESGKFVKYIPLSKKRADRLSIRLAGTGDVTLLDMQRKYSLGSDLGNGTI